VEIFWGEKYPWMCQKLRPRFWPEETTICYKISLIQWLITNLNVILYSSTYHTVNVVGQLSSQTRHCVLAVAALDRSLSMVWWRWHISVSQLCFCWSMALSFWVASITVCVCSGVRPREYRSLDCSSERTLNFLLNWKEWKRNQRDVSANLRG